ncbi:hypothetical protein GCM10010282_66460 [Streptomyces roseolus]|nr:hypothetical protein GCM10010282_66460 [Streptomyces roseolus]
MLHRGNCGQYLGVASLLVRSEVIIAVEEFTNLEMCGICSQWGSLASASPSGVQPEPGSGKSLFPKGCPV